MSITIKDIAKIAGVSHTTVSRALNDSPLISIVQKKRILKIAKAKNYSPNMLARGLSGNHSFTIGVILNYFGNMFAQRIMNGVENMAEKNGYVMIFGDSRENAEREKKYIKTFADRGVDGLIIYPVTMQDNSMIIPLLKELGKPYVMVNHQPHGTRSDLVSCDHYQGGMIAAQHLIKLNHRHIGVLGGKGMSPGSDFVKGYISALEQAGIGFDKNYLKVFPGSYLDKNIVAGATRELLEEQPEITALMLYSDEIIPGVNKALQELNIDVPRDLSLIGYGNIPGMSFGHTRLSNIGYKKELVGEKAMELLLRKINTNDSDISNILLPMELINGDTCRPI